ncbi:MAG: hypothetical protein IKW64_06130 [Clostridia bacterium]|nr:hypothetical protein [Clostridia bacterium]
MFKKRRCCRSRPSAVGFFFIAIGSGLFLAYVIPRYLLITMLGMCLIGAGVCIIIKK